jgi:hypothetical protein
MSAPCIYINPSAPRHIRRMMDKTFPDVPRVTANHIEELVGGFTDGGPGVATYAAALVDETGKLTLYEGYPT